MIRNLAKSILEGLDEILTVSRLGLPAELRRSLACTNIIENMIRHGKSGHPQRGSAGVRPRWPCAGLPRPCTKPRRAFAG
jgi:putative transposase